jgi:hypothetical protein
MFAEFGWQPEEDSNTPYRPQITPDPGSPPLRKTNPGRISTEINHGFVISACHEPVNSQSLIPKEILPQRLTLP